MCAKFEQSLIYIYAANTSFTIAFLEVPDKDSNKKFFTGWLWKLAPEIILRPLDWWSVKHSSFWTNMQQATYHTRSVCTQELLYETEAFPHRSFCTKKLINTQNFFTGRSAQRQFFTHRSFSKQKLSHRHYYTQTEITLSISFRQCFARQGKSKDSENTCKILNLHKGFVPQGNLWN